MTNSQLLKQIKRIPIIVYCLLGIFTLITVYQTCQKVGHEVRITATLKYAGGKTIAKVNVKDGKFVTGYEGDWQVRVANFENAVLLNIANSTEMFRFYDLLFILVLNSFIFYATYKLKEDIIISEGSINAIQLASYMIFLSPLLDLGYGMLAQKAMEYLTHKQLTISLPNVSYYKVMLSIFLAPLVPLMARRFRNLQMEQNTSIL